MLSTNGGSAFTIHRKSSKTRRNSRCPMEVMSHSFDICICGDFCPFSSVAFKKNELKLTVGSSNVFNILRDSKNKKLSYKKYL